MSTDQTRNEEEVVKEQSELSNSLLRGMISTEEST